jgi:REP element-mobilizing transposase RayT
MVMFDDHGFPKFETNDFPLAYLITFRTYGTWHHGDVRYSVGRSGMNIFNGPKFQPSIPFADLMKSNQIGPSVVLSDPQREIVATTLKEVCEHRCWVLHGQNVRTNHVHSVVAASTMPEKIVNDHKSYATRRLREAGEFGVRDRIWSRGASTRYLWKPRHVEAAIQYVLHGQGDVPFEMD